MGWTLVHNNYTKIDTTTMITAVQKNKQSYAQIPNRICCVIGSKRTVQLGQYVKPYQNALECGKFTITLCFRYLQIADDDCMSSLANVSN